MLDQFLDPIYDLQNSNYSVLHATKIDFLAKAIVLVESNFIIFR